MPLREKKSWKKSNQKKSDLHNLFDKTDARYLMEWKLIAKQEIWRDIQQKFKTSRLGMLAHSKKRIWSVKLVDSFWNRMHTEKKLKPIRDLFSWKCIYN